MPWWTNQKGESQWTDGSWPPNDGNQWSQTANKQTDQQKQAQQPAQQGPVTLQGYTFGGSTQNLGPGGLVAPNTAAQTANDLNAAMARKAPTIAGADFSGMGQTQGTQLGLLNQMQNYAQGLGPSAANIGNTMAMGQAAAAGRAGMAGGNALASRAGLGASMGGVNNAAMQGAQARTQETGNMFGALGKQSMGLSNNAQGASSLADLQIQQQQALGLGQAQRNYQLGQGLIGTAAQENMDQLTFAQKMAAIAQQKKNDIFNAEAKDAAAGAQAAGSFYAKA